MSAHAVALRHRLVVGHLLIENEYCTRIRGFVDIVGKDRRSYSLTIGTNILLNLAREFLEQSSSLLIRHILDRNKNFQIDIVRMETRYAHARSANTPFSCDTNTNVGKSSSTDGAIQELIGIMSSCLSRDCRRFNCVLAKIPREEGIHLFTRDRTAG